jgi:hypothetical protein
VLALEGGGERVPPIPVGPRDSDTTPSMWRGTVTFARHAPAHADVWQILSWSPRHPRRLVTLQHGRVPECHGPQRRACERERPQATVAALDSDGAIVTFLWAVTSPETGPHVAEEVRVDRVDGRGSALAYGELAGDVCMGATGHELESAHPEAPIASGASALFATLNAYGCLHEFGSYLLTHTAAPGHASRGELGVATLALAEDEGQLYGLVPEPVAEPGVLDAPPCTAARPCAIEPLARPTLKRNGRLPFEPFASG